MRVFLGKNQILLSVAVNGDPDEKENSTQEKGTSLATFDASTDVVYKVNLHMESTRVMCHTHWTLEGQC